MTALLTGFEGILHDVAKLAAYTLEMVGILIIVIGSAVALFHLFKCLKERVPNHVIMDLGRVLSLALTFKMGAEIINTVVIHNLQELSILGAVILIRAFLAVIIHWELKAEKNADQDGKNKKEEKAEK